MSAIVFDRCGPPEVLREAEIPIPSPRSDELLIHVAATSVNPIDWRIRRGEMWPVLPRHRPYIVGFDLSGTVIRTGSSVASFSEGDTVVGLLAPWQRGATSEYAVISAKRAAKKPPQLGFDEAAALPLAGLTAYDALVHRSRIGTGTRLLIVGASGGVGTYAVQIGKLYGAHVTTVTSRRNVELVKELGADACIAYDEEEVHGRYDLIFDVVGTMSYPSAQHHLEPRGEHIALVPSIANVPGFLLGRSSLSLLPDISGLPALLDLAASGKVRSVIEHVYPMSQLVEAHRHSESKRARGKLVVRTTRETA